jgi:hypothetical protein
MHPRPRGSKPGAMVSPEMMSALTVRRTVRRTFAVASDFGPLIPQAGETGCHLPQPGGTEGASVSVLCAFTSVAGAQPRSKLFTLY